MKKNFISFIVATTTLVSFHAGIAMQRATFENCVQLLHANGAEALKTMLTTNPNLYNRYGDTLLHAAAYYGYAYKIRTLVGCGIPLDATNTSGDSALHIAARQRFHATVVALLNCDAHRNPQNKRSGETPLHATIPRQKHVPVLKMNSCCQVVELLLMNGANPNILDNNGRTPLDIALQFRHRTIACVLLAYGATINATTDAATLKYFRRLRKELVD